MIPGTVRRLKDEHYFVYGLVPSKSPILDSDVEGIGVNLKTNEVVTISPYSVEVAFPFSSHLNYTEIENLGHHLTVWSKLRKRVLAISGKARSGKDTTAKEVAKHFNSCIITPLADPIYKIERIVYGTKQGKNRKGLILIGQGLRGKDPHIWIKVWLRNAIEELTYYPHTSFIVNDVRQPNEFKFFDSIEALTVKVVADEEKRLEKIRSLDGEQNLTDELLNDETESHIDKFKTDIVIENNYDDSFFNDIEKVVGLLRRDKEMM
jgi:hypothetical protein